MKLLATSFAAGVVFAVGLTLSGMTRPTKVIGFLDFTGDWDPSLLFVMGGAVAVYFAFFRVVTRRERPLLAAKFSLPTRRDITPRLVIGAAVFGFGWGLAGYCPGPALTSLSTGATEAFVFVTAMIAGMYLFTWVDPHLSRRNNPQSETTKRESEKRSSAGTESARPGFSAKELTHDPAN